MKSFSTIAVRFLSALAVAVFWAGGALADKRVALVIGNSDYARPALKLVNPANDARDLAQALKQIGFDEVVLRTDVGKTNFDQALVDFARKAKNADTALFYYAGHGIQRNGKNYFLPTDIDPHDEFDFNYFAINQESILDAVGQAKSVRIVVLDACRDNPLGKQYASRSFGGGLAPIEGVEEAVIAYAAAFGRVAYDGKGRNSPFASALIKRVKEPGLEVTTMFRRVTNDVVEETNGAQHPEITSSLRSDYILNSADTDAWGRIRESSDTAVLKDFIQKFPSSPFARDAQNRIDLLESIRRENEEYRKEVERRASEAEKKYEEEEKRREEERSALEAKRQRDEEEERKQAIRAAVEAERKRIEEAIKKENELRADAEKKRQQEEAAKKEAERRALEAERTRQEEAARKEAERLAALEAERKRQEEAARKEADRLAQEAEKKRQEEAARQEAARKEAERLALEAEKRRQAEEAAKKEAERLALEAQKKQTEEAARKEAERLAQEAERKRQQEEAARKEAERVAAEAEKRRQQEAAKKEAERLAAEAEKKRQEELAAKQEAERLAQEAEKKRKDEAARKEAERLAQEKRAAEERRIAALEEEQRTKKEAEEEKQRVARICAADQNALDQLARAQQTAAIEKLGKDTACPTLKPAIETALKQIARAIKEACDTDRKALGKAKDLESLKAAVERMSCEPVRSDGQQRIAKLEDELKRNQAVCADESAKLHAIDQTAIVARQQYGEFLAHSNCPSLATETNSLIKKIDSRVKEAQTQLARLGCYSGKANGKFDEATKHSLDVYYGKKGAKADSDHLGDALLSELQSQNLGVCPEEKPQAPVIAKPVEQPAKEQAKRVEEPEAKPAKHRKIEGAAREETAPEPKAPKHKSHTAAREETAPPEPPRPRAHRAVREEQPEPPPHRRAERAPRPSAAPERVVRAPRMPMGPAASSGPPPSAAVHGVGF